MEKASVTGLKGLDYLDKTLPDTPKLKEDRDQVIAFFRYSMYVLHIFKCTELYYIISRTKKLFSSWILGNFEQFSNKMQISISWFLQVTLSGWTDRVYLGPSDAVNIQGDIT